MLELGILLTFLIIFYFMYQKDKKDRDRVDTIMKTFDNTLSGIFQTVQKTQDTFYDMIGKVEMEHFKQLEKTSDKQMVFHATQLDKILELMREQKSQEEKIIERITPIDTLEKNSIEKEEELANPLGDFDPSMIKNIKNIQFEGEEEIYPLSNE